VRVAVAWPEARARVKAFNMAERLATVLADAQASSSPSSPSSPPAAGGRGAGYGPLRALLAAAADSAQVESAEPPSKAPRRAGGASRRASGAPAALPAPLLAAAKAHGALSAEPPPDGGERVRGWLRACHALLDVAWWCARRGGAPVADVLQLELAPGRCVADVLAAVLASAGDGGTRYVVSSSFFLCVAHTRTHARTRTHTADQGPLLTIII
jgi:hypothetical protein